MENLPNNKVLWISTLSLKILTLPQVLVASFLFVAVAVARPQATLDENGEMFDVSHKNILF